MTLEMRTVVVGFTTRRARVKGGIGVYERIQGSSADFRVRDELIRWLIREGQWLREEKIERGKGNILAIRFGESSTSSRRVVGNVGRVLVRGSAAVVLVWWE